jgi:hypothetical protein
MIPSPRSYGLSLSQDYSTYLHDNTDAYKDVFDGAWKARDQMVWLIKKGDVIFSNAKRIQRSNFSRRFSLNDSKVFHTNFIEYTGDFEGTSRFQKLASVPASKYIALVYLTF